MRDLSNIWSTNEEIMALEGNPMGEGSSAHLFYLGSVLAQKIIDHLPASYFSVNSYQENYRGMLPDIIYEAGKDLCQDIARLLSGGSHNTDTYIEIISSDLYRKYYDLADWSYYGRYHKTSDLPSPPDTQK